MTLLSLLEDLFLTQKVICRFGLSRNLLGTIPTSFCAVGHIVLPQEGVGNSSTSYYTERHLSMSSDRSNTQIVGIEMGDANEVDKVVLANQERTPLPGMDQYDTWRAERS